MCRETWYGVQLHFKMSFEGTALKHKANHLADVRRFLIFPQLRGNICPRAEQKKRQIFFFFIRAWRNSSRINLHLDASRWLPLTSNMPYAHTFVLQWLHSLSCMQATLHLLSQNSVRVEAPRDNEPRLETPWGRLYCVRVHDVCTAQAIWQQDGVH